MKVNILRIYTRTGSKIRGKLSFWRKLFGADLSFFLVKRAKEYGIGQAIAQRSTVGYLKGNKISFDGVEAIPPDLPVCVELIDEEEKLRSFLVEQKDQLVECRVVLFEGVELNAAV